MAHSHSHSEPSYQKAFAIGVGLNLLYVGAEAAFGFKSDSLALLADAGHNLGDVLGLLLAWGAHYLSRAPATSRRTYGWRRTSILAALANAIVLLLAVGGITWEALQRLRAPQPALGSTIILVAAVGVVVNAVTAWLFVAGRKKDLNLRAAFLHMAADAGVSLAVVGAGIAIAYTGLLWIDPVTSLAVAAVILVSTWSLLRDSVNLAVDAVPKGINPGEVENYLAGLPGVTEVHDLHIWPLSTTQTALTAHLVRPGSISDDQFLACICSEVHERFGIDHSTVQIEQSEAGDPCRRQLRQCD